MQEGSSNLIFLISQPRSGSTLLQRILGSHPNIYTKSETWILLHPLFSFRFEEFVTPYNSWLYTLGLKDFISILPGGETRYRDAFSQLYLGFYNSILEKEGKTLFLDKTPRYFHIVNELIEFFPNAKFVFLFRNPAAVISSIINTFTKEEFSRLSDFRHDLLFAPKKILTGIKTAGPRAYSLRYESLLDDPIKELTGICSFLGIEYTNTMLHYNKTLKSKWRFGDQINVYQHDKPNNALKDRWVNALNIPKMWKIVSDYVQTLGRELVFEMGYDYDKIIYLLEENKPKYFDEDDLSLEKIFQNNTDLAIENFNLKKNLNELKYRINQLNEIAIQQQNLIGELANRLSELTDLLNKNGIEV